MATDRTIVAAAALHDPNKGYDDEGGNIKPFRFPSLEDTDIAVTPLTLLRPHRSSLRAFAKRQFSHRFAPHFQGAQFVFLGRTNSVLEGRGGLNERRNVGVVINRCNQSAAPLYLDSTGERTRIGMWQMQTNEM